LDLTAKNIQAAILQEGRTKNTTCLDIVTYVSVIDQSYIVKRSVHILQGLLQIATVKQWLKAAILIMDLQQDLLQALYPGDASVKQLPYINNQLLRRYYRSKKKQINTVQQLLDLSEPERKSLLNPLSESEYLDVMEVAQRVPRLSVKKAIFKGKGKDKRHNKQGY
jgi:translocation protein SEC63